MRSAAIVWHSKKLTVNDFNDIWRILSTGNVSIFVLVFRCVFPRFECAAFVQAYGVCECVCVHESAFEIIDINQR